MAIALITKIPQALGNGDRPAGFVLGTFQGSEIDAGELATSIWHSPDAIASIDRTEGVTDIELISACRSVGTSCAIVDQDAQPVPKPQTAAAPAQPTPADLSKITVESLGLSPGVQTTLIEQVGATVADLQSFADANDGFQSLDKIGPEAEAKIMEAIKAKL